MLLVEQVGGEGAGDTDDHPRGIGLGIRRTEGHTDHNSIRKVCGVACRQVEAGGGGPTGGAGVQSGFRGDSCAVACSCVHDALAGYSFDGDKELIFAYGFRQVVAVCVWRLKKQEKDGFIIKLIKKT